MTANNHEIARMLREFRLDVPLAASRMPWAREWPLDRLMCAAADALDALSPSVGEATSEGSVSVNPEKTKDLTRVDSNS